MPGYRPLVDRFWEKALRCEEGCWPWTGYLTKTGYGMIGLSRSRRIERAHRVAWVLTNGPIPDGLSVLHHCDNRGCVRPDHLFLGTQADNIADMRAKGRANDRRPKRPGAHIGVKNPRARLTVANVWDIRAMRKDGMKFAEIALRFGVATPTIQHIISGKNWSHIG